MRTLLLRTPTTLVVVGAVFVASCGSSPVSNKSVQSAASTATPIPVRMPAPSNETLIARAKPFELATPYEAPPGDPLEHNTSGYAKTMCSAVFITGLDPDVAAESVGYFTGPYAERKKVGKPVVDRAKKDRITLPNGVTVVARHFGSQGCISLPRGRDDVFFKPVDGDTAPARRQDDRVADGRRAVERTAACGHRRGQSPPRGRSGIRTRRRLHIRLRRDVQRAPDWRTLR